MNDFEKSGYKNNVMVYTNWFLTNDYKYKTRVNPFQFVDSEVLPLIPYLFLVFITSCEIQKRAIFTIKHAKENR